MHKTMNIWILLAVCACVLVGFFWYNSTLTESLDELDAVYNEAKMRLTEMQGEKTELENTANNVGTDAFIENQARTLYGYIMPDEIRFVIDNPEALYGTKEIPSP